MRTRTTFAALALAASAIAVTGCTAATDAINQVTSAAGVATSAAGALPSAGAVSKAACTAASGAWAEGASQAAIAKALESAQTTIEVALAGNPDLPGIPQLRDVMTEAVNQAKSGNPLSSTVIDGLKAACTPFLD